MESSWTENAIESWLDTLDPKKLTFKKMVFVIKQCLNVISLDDACHYMEKHKLQVSNENIEVFLCVADKYYKIRTKILEELVLEEYNKSKYLFALFTTLFTLL